MNPNRRPALGTCPGFLAEFKKMQSEVPTGSGGNGVVKTQYPYGVTPVKYFPSGSSSVGRSMSDVWRYGMNYTGPNERKIYGEPDWKFYRQNYCGPCGCAPPGFVGDPNGQNPNIRYVQLDYNNILGTDLAEQGISLGSIPGNQNSPMATSCNRQNCTECSGVYKKREQPVKFQVCIGHGHPSCPDSMPSCPQQDLRTCVPNQMLPCASQPQNPCCEVTPTCCGGGDEGNEGEKLPDFEVQIPDITGGDSGSMSCDINDQKPGYTCVDPCGNCKACKTTTVSKNSPECAKARIVRAPQGQRYTTGPVLCDVKKPIHPVKLRKSVRRNCM